MAIRPFPSFRFQQLNRAYQTDPRNLLGKQLQQTGISTAPVATPLQGLGRLAQALVGAKLQRDAIDAQAKREDDFTNQITSMIPENTSPALRSFAIANPTAFSNALASNLLQPTTSSEVVDLGGNLRGVKTTQTGPFGQESTSISNLTQIKPNALTTAQKNAVALGLTPGTDEFNKYIRDVTGKSGTNINVSTGVPFTKEQEKFGELRAKNVSENIIAPASKADETIQNIDTALKLLEQNPNISGLGEEGILRLKETVGGLVRLFGVDPEKAGIDLDKIGQQQVFESIVNKLVLDQTSKLKGALSNKELDFSGRATAQLGTSVEANKVILAFQKQAAIKAINLSEKAQEYFDANNTFGKGKIGEKTYSSVDAYLREYKNNNEIFGPDLIQSFQTPGEIKVYRDFRGKRITEIEKDALIKRATEIRGNN